MKKVLVVINPKAGVKSKQRIDSKITDLLGKDFLVEFQWWEGPDFDITAVVNNRVESENFDIVVAAGGDGTVNRTAKALINTEATFAILPLGSGNGLARHFKIPMDLGKAADVIINGSTIKMDTCLINNENFFCTAGTGFDAHIGHLFANAKKRGFKTYMKIVSREYRKYKPSDYTIICDGKEMETKAFLITVANANQYGNNVFIAPVANITDGFMDLVILKPFSVIHAPALAGRLFLKNFHKAVKTDNFKAKEIIITRKENGPVHYDGEPAIMEDRLHFKILPASLNMRIPKTKKG